MAWTGMGGFLPPRMGGGQDRQMARRRMMADMLDRPDMGQRRPMTAPTTVMAQPRMAMPAIGPQRAGGMPPEMGKLPKMATPRVGAGFVPPMQKPIADFAQPKAAAMRGQRPQQPVMRPATPQGYSSSAAGLPLGQFRR